MFDLFSSELPLPVRFAIAFVVVLLLFVAAAWLVKRLGGAKLATNGTTGGRNRQPRLGVLDVHAIDSRRRLVIVRRDNVEHLLMIGGPNDLVIEASIVRVPHASREAPSVELGRQGEAPRAPIAAPVPVATQAGSRPAQRPAPPAPASEGEFGSVMRAQGPVIRPSSGAPSAPPPQRPAPAVRTAPPPPEPTAEDEPIPGRPAPSVPRPSRPVGAPPPRVQGEPPARPAPPPPPPPVTARPRPGRAPEPAPPPPASAAPAADPLFTDIAQRLEQALRRPAPSTGRTPPPPAGRPAGQGPGPSEPPPADQNKPAPDSLEDEMASLLGRETGRDGGGRGR